MSEPSPEAKLAAENERDPLEGRQTGYYVQQAIDTAAAKAREELETAQHLAELWEMAERNAVKELAKVREELEISHRLEQAAWKVANERLDQQPSAPTSGLIQLNEQQKELIVEWARDNDAGDLWGNNEARRINLETFARSILSKTSEGKEL